jgi:DNA-binding response OmpR family regulator
MLPGDKLNLERINFLILDDNQQSLDIIAQTVIGFGVRSIFKCQSARDARQIMARNTIDFIISDAQMPDEDGYTFLQWVRREATEPNRFAPAIICTGHTRLSQIIQARDCGAHFIVVKPITPKILLERIFWVGREERSFIECSTYAGPDRRFKRLGPPFGIDGRREDDINTSLGAAREPNLSQDEINSFMKPAKVAL